MQHVSTIQLAIASFSEALTLLLLSKDLCTASHVALASKAVAAHACHSDMSQVMLILYFAMPATEL